MYNVKAIIDGACNHSRLASCVAPMSSRSHCDTSAMLFAASRCILPVQISRACNADLSVYITRCIYCHAQSSNLSLRWHTTVPTTRRAAALQKSPEVAKNCEKYTLRKFRVVRGCRILHQSKGHMRLPIPIASRTHHVSFDVARGRPLANMLTNFISRTLDTLRYPSVKTASSYVHSFWHNNGVWRTDRQTDGRRDITA